jgi:hypothetical protein
MATANAPGGPPTAQHRAVLVDGVNCVLAAGGCKSTLPAQESAKRSAVQNDQLNQYPAHCGTPNFWVAGFQYGLFN